MRTGREKARAYSYLDFTISILCAEGEERKREKESKGGDKERRTAGL